MKWAIDKIKDVIRRQSRNLKGITKKDVKRLIIYSIIIGVISCLILYSQRRIFNNFERIFNITAVLVTLIGGFILSFSLTQKSLRTYYFIVSGILIYFSFYTTVGILFAWFLTRYF